MITLGERLFLVLAQDPAPTTTATTTPPPSTKNPLDGVFPDFTIFGARVTSIWQKLAAGLWGLGILATILYLGAGLVQMAQHRGGGHPGQLREAKHQAVIAGIALGGLLALATIVGAFITIFS